MYANKQGVYVCEQKNLAASVQGIARLNKICRRRKTFRIQGGGRDRELSGTGGRHHRKAARHRELSGTAITGRQGLHPATDRF